MSTKQVELQDPELDATDAHARLLLLAERTDIAAPKASG